MKAFQFSSVRCSGQSSKIGGYYFALKKNRNCPFSALKTVVLYLAGGNNPKSKAIRAVLR